MGNQRGRIFSNVLLELGCLIPQESYSILHWARYIIHWSKATKGEFDLKQKQLYQCKAGKIRVWLVPQCSNVVCSHQFRASFLSNDFDHNVRNRGIHDHIMERSSSKLDFPNVVVLMQQAATSRQALKEIKKKCKDKGSKESFQDEASYGECWPKSQGIPRWHIKDNDKGSKSRSQSMKEQAYNKEQRERPRPHELNDKSNLIDLMKECHQ
ncbi:hypothetical protein Tco_1343970 [Tanacetum coccineum]